MTTPRTTDEILRAIAAMTPAAAKAAEAQIRADLCEFITPAKARKMLRNRAAPPTPGIDYAAAVDEVTRASLAAGGAKS